MMELVLSVNFIRLTVQILLDLRTLQSATMLAYYTHVAKIISLRYYFATCPIPPPT